MAHGLLIAVAYLVTGHRLKAQIIAFYFSLGDFFFVAALGLHGCMHVFSSCGQGGSSLVTLHGLLAAMASLAVEHGL